MSEHERRVEYLRQHNHRLQRRLAEAEARAARSRETLLSGAPLQAAINAVARLDRTGGPDPNGYVRYTPRDYAVAAISAALDAPGDTDADPFATTITPLQREAVVRALIREARDSGYSEDFGRLIPWLWSRISDAPGDPEGQ